MFKYVLPILFFLFMGCDDQKYGTSGSYSGVDTVKIETQSAAQIDSLKKVYPDGQVVQQQSSDGRLLTYFVMYHLLFGGSGQSYVYRNPSQFYTSTHSSSSYTYTHPNKISSYKSSSSSSSYKSSYKSSSYRSSGGSSYRSSGRSGGRR